MKEEETTGDSRIKFLQVTIARLSHAPKCKPLKASNIAGSKSGRYWDRTSDLFRVSEDVSKLHGQSESTGHTLKRRKPSKMPINKCLVESVVDS